MHFHPQVQRKDPTYRILQVRAREQQVQQVLFKLVPAVHVDGVSMGPSTPRHAYRQTQ